MSVTGRGIEIDAKNFHAALSLELLEFIRAFFAKGLLFFLGA